MAKPVLLLTRKLPAAIEARAARDYDARLNRRRAMWAMTAPRSPAAPREARPGILCAAGDNLDAATITALPDSVKIIATFTVGSDHMDLRPPRRAVSWWPTRPRCSPSPPPRRAFTLMLMAARRAGEGERMVRAGKWDGWAPTQLMGVTLEGKRLGILGMGRIGRELAHMARGFRMEIHYRDVSRCRPNRSRVPPSTPATTPSSAPSTCCPCTSPAARRREVAERRAHRAHEARLYRHQQRPRHHGGRRGAGRGADVRPYPRRRP